MRKHFTKCRYNVSDNIPRMHVAAAISALAPAENMVGAKNNRNFSWTSHFFSSRCRRGEADGEFSAARLSTYSNFARGQSRYISRLNNEPPSYDLLIERGVFPSLTVTAAAATSLRAECQGCCCCCWSRGARVFLRKFLRNRTRGGSRAGISEENSNVSAAMSSSILV